MRIKLERVLQDFIDMEQMELSYYSEEHVTPHEEAYQWYLANPHTDVAVEDNGKIIAFSDILPLKSDVYEKVLKGDFNDKNLTSSDLFPIEDMKEGAAFNLLLSCIVVHQDYRKTDALKIALNHHLDYYRELIKKGIQIDWVLTSNVTLEGERFSQRMGFEWVGRTSHESTLYRIRFSDFDQRVREMRVKNNETRVSL